MSTPDTGFTPMSGDFESPGATNDEPLVATPHAYIVRVGKWLRNYASVGPDIERRREASALADEAREVAKAAAALPLNTGLVDPTEATVPAVQRPAVALESVELTRDVYGMCIVKVNGREAIRDNGDVISHFATLDWFAGHRPVTTKRGRRKRLVGRYRIAGGRVVEWDIDSAADGRPDGVYMLFSPITASGLLIMPGPAQGLRAVLAELVDLKHVKDRGVEAGIWDKADDMRSAYEARKPLAWVAAERALAAFDCSQERIKPVNFTQMTEP